MINNEIYESNLQHFKIKKRYGDKAQCQCPAHDDKHASLTITKGRKCTLFYCHAGCSVDEVLKAAGVDKRDTFYDIQPRSPNWKTYVERMEHGKIEDTYNYVYFNGNYAYTKIRLQGKKILYGTLENDRFTYGLRGKSRKNAMYGDVKSLNKAISEGRTIFIPEGEKDVNTLKRKGYTALTYGAVNDWQQTMAQFFKDANVVILADNDSPGISAANNIECDLRGVAKNVKVIVPTPSIPKGDISDYFQAGHSKQEFEQLISNSVTENRVKVSDKSYTLVNKLIELEVAKKFATNDKASAELFATVFKNVSRYNPTQKDWMYYDGIKWISDIEGLRARKNAKDLADALLSYAIGMSDLDEKQRQDYLKYASRMMNYRDRNTVVNDAKDLNFFENEELDKEDYLLNCQNCVLDLSGDEPKILQHDADLLLSKVCNVSYNPAAKCDLWKKTIYEIMEGDMDKIKYLQKILGLSLTGYTSEEELYFFYGASTRNGKSTVCETVLSLLGNYGTTISPETLAIKNNKDSRTASPDIAKLAGARLVIASEPPKRMIFDTSLVKTLTGRDRVTARFLHQNEFTFTPKFKLLLNTNYLPTITDSTIFKSGRIRVIPFNKHFGEGKQNKYLKDDLRKELDGILNWLLEGLYMYRHEGLAPPDTIVASTREYESDSDKIGRFISECLIKSGKNASAKTTYEVYSRWCTDAGLGVDGRNNFYIELKTRGIFATSGTVKGKTVRNIVRGYSLAEEEFMTASDEFSTPFD